MDDRNSEEGDGRGECEYEESQGALELQLATFDASSQPKQYDAFACCGSQAQR
jgi:hypothetical protein